MTPAFRSMLWYLLVGTRGGPNRMRILEVLEEGPSNAHQLSERLELDYRTVRHHLLVLERNGAVNRPVGSAYASPYELVPYLSAHLEVMRELRTRGIATHGRWARRSYGSAATGDPGGNP